MYKMVLHFSLYCSTIDSVRKGLNMNKQIGKLNQKVIELLNLKYESEIPIILGDSNIEHMKNMEKIFKK